jgi:hypothetical protein
MEAQTIMQPADETNVTGHLPRRHGTWQRLRHLVPVSLALALILSLGSVEAWAKTNVNTPSETSVPAQVDPAGSPTSPGLGSAAPAKGSDYAAREARTPGLSNFEGGDLVIIGSGGLILVLLIILLILLV